MFTACYILQLACLCYGHRLLAIEVECKVNSRPTYTRYYYWMNTAVYLAAVVNCIVHKYDSDVSVTTDRSSY